MNQFSKFLFSLSVMFDSCDPMACSTPGFPVGHHLKEFVQTHVHWVGDAIQPSHPLSSPSASNLSSIRVFSNESALLSRWPKYWSFGISLAMSIQDYILCDWLVWSPYCPRDSWVFSSTTVLKPSVLFYCPAVTFVPGYWKNHNFDYTGLYGQSDVSMLFRFVITFLPRSKRLLISWLQSPSAVILKPKKIKSYCFHPFPIYLPWSDGTECLDLYFLNVEF